MAIKPELVRILESRKGQNVSGQELAERLGVSRTAVWKAVNSLRTQGYQIEATTNRGYRLAEESDCLSAEGIRLALPPEAQNHPLILLPEVDSTNSYAKRRAMDGGADGEIILANHQTAGRGRLGRSFFSPADSGIYISFLLRPKIPLEQAVLFTITAAVAVCQTIEACTDQKPRIKWVNDIFIDDKKVCGILTEAVSNFETGMAESVVVGIGINLKTESSAFPPEVQRIATSLHLKGISRNQFAALLITHFFALAAQPDRQALLTAYKERSLVLGKRITFHRQEAVFSAVAEDINAQGNLIVRMDDGTRETLRSGEISIGSGNIS